MVAAPAIRGAAQFFLFTRSRLAARDWLKASPSCRAGDLAGTAGQPRPGGYGHYRRDTTGQTMVSTGLLAPVPRKQGNDRPPDLTESPLTGVPGRTWRRIKSVTPMAPLSRYSRGFQMYRRRISSMKIRGKTSVHLIEFQNSTRQSGHVFWQSPTGISRRVRLLMCQKEKVVESRRSFARVSGFRDS